ncbi:MAG: molybdenum cofactor cytidylyltransferase [Chloroflexi bacterium]|nr:MAG: molybdenum cofactor cytidylyltransferase [Chloroflexota bacterium]
MTREHLAALLLAAGESTRMGRSKAMLTWHGKYLIEYQIASIIASGVKEIVVVLGHEASRIISSVKFDGPTKIVTNEHYKCGKSSSVIVGLQNMTQRAGDTLILAVDQPRRPKLLTELIEAHRISASKITLPIFQNKGGHPVIFSNTLLPSMMNIDESTQGLRHIVDSNSEFVNRWETQNPEVLLDLNTIGDYITAKDVN